MSDPVPPLQQYLVEDSPIIVRLLRGLLSVEPGIRIVGHSPSAASAVEEITRLAPDIAIVDIALENSSGFEVLKFLAVKGANRPIVIVLSNYATARYREEALRLGADYFFDKNGEILDLLKTIAELRKGRR